MTARILEQVPPRLRRHTALGSTAIHEAGHAAMAFTLDRGITRVTIEADDDAGSLGQMGTRPIGSWFRPDVEVTRKTMNLVEAHVMISLAGFECETAWSRELPDAPPEWEQRVSDGSEHDLASVFELASVVSCSDEETSAYIDWLGLRSQNQMTMTFWPMVGALADALLDRRTMSGAATRAVLREAVQDWLIRGRSGVSKS